jgi:hypothetical protein
MRMRRVVPIAVLAVVAGTALLASTGSRASTHPGQVTLKIYFTGEKVRPARIYTSEASYCSLWATHLKQWKHWGARKTFSKGYLHYSTGNPNCAEGSHLTRGEVLLSHIRRCHGGRRYQRMQFFYFKRPRYNARFDLDCHGNLSFHQ